MFDILLTYLCGGWFCQIVAAAPIAAGCEVHNTYGELANSELVNKYGFACRSNPFDFVEVDRQVLVKQATKLLGAKAAQKRVKFLQNYRYSNPFYRGGHKF